ncbi:MAG: hypothetical protein R2825_06285 [Saprospiraceae bacterium]
MISFYLKERMPVRLEVMDLAGRKTILIDEEMEAGWQETTIGSSSATAASISTSLLPLWIGQRKMVLSY